MNISEEVKDCAKNLFDISMKLKDINPEYSEMALFLADKVLRIVEAKKPHKHSNTVEPKEESAECHHGNCSGTGACDDCKCGKDGKYVKLLAGKKDNDDCYGHKNSGICNGHKNNPNMTCNGHRNDPIGAERKVDENKVKSEIQSIIDRIRKGN